MNKEQLDEKIFELLKKYASWTNDEKENIFGWLNLESPDKIEPLAQMLASCSARLCTITAYSVKRNDQNKRLAIAYHFVVGNFTFTVTAPLYSDDNAETLPVPSITPWFQNADWNEREFKEMYNINIINHPNPKRLFLDERLDAGIMDQLVPFSALSNSANTKDLWEKIMSSNAAQKMAYEKAIVTAVLPQVIEPKFTPVKKDA
ncbi:NADH dehydrogenase subunit C [Desulfovibrio litoralis DSM 11393]|uniref:NADH dehydrogenase subunit C n=2 Tax=Desulfovibrio litoralis TaxID=466107 RepID=A0A1M7S1A6_9BACT|nr:NADH dehydrogenase subunit C [Desulfovibrio litoralis DSM 11393]